MGEVIDLEAERRARAQARARRDQALRDAERQQGVKDDKLGDGKLGDGGPKEPTRPGRDGGAGPR